MEPPPREEKTGNPVIVFPLSEFSVLNMLKIWESVTILLPNNFVKIKQKQAIIQA